MMEKILLGSSYLAQAIVMATIAFAVISTIYYLRYNKKIISCVDILLKSNL